MIDEGGGSVDPQAPPLIGGRSVQIAAVIVESPVLEIGSPAGLFLAYHLALFMARVVDEPFPRAAMAIVPDT